MTWWLGWSSGVLESLVDEQRASWEDDPVVEMVPCIAFLTR